MEFFTFLSKSTVHLPPKRKVISSEDFSSFIQAKEVLDKAKEESLDYREDIAKECEVLRERAEVAGYEAGLTKWNEQIAYLERQVIQIRKDMENAIILLAMTAIKKIVGREIEINPETVVDIVATALKPVSQHKKISIFVNRLDYDEIEKKRPRLRQIFEHLEMLTIQVRDDVTQGGCIIETEAGIINAQLENQWKALENAFYYLMRTDKQ